MLRRELSLSYTIDPYVVGTRTAKKYFCRLAEKEVHVAPHGARAHHHHGTPLTREPLARVVALIRAPLNSTLTPRDIEAFFEEASYFALRAPEGFPAAAKNFPSDPSGPNTKLLVQLEGPHQALEELDYACRHLRLLHGMNGSGLKFVLSDMDDKAAAAGGWSTLSVTLVRFDVRDLSTTTLVSCRRQERGAAETAPAAASSSEVAIPAASPPPPPLRHKVKLVDRFPYELLHAIRRGAEELVLNRIPLYFSRNKVVVASLSHPRTGTRVFAWDHVDMPRRGRDCCMAKVLLRGKPEDIETFCQDYHHRILYVAWCMTVIVLDRPLASYDDASFLGSLLLPLFPQPPADWNERTHKVQPFSIVEPRTQRCDALDRFCHY